MTTDYKQNAMKPGKRSNKRSAAKKRNHRAARSERKGTVDEHVARYKQQEPLAFGFDDQYAEMVAMRHRATQLSPAERLVESAGMVGTPWAKYFNGARVGQDVHAVSHGSHMRRLIQA